MPSRIDDLVTEIAGKFDDTGVVFLAGKLRINEHNQQRVIIFHRKSGVLEHKAVPGAVRLGTPVGNAGSVTKQIFSRSELIEVRLRDVDEEALDNMLDRFAHAVFKVAGPNALAAPSPYAWFGEDSKNGGDWVRRNPQIIIQMTVDLRSIPQNNPYALLVNTEAGVEESGETVDVTAP